MMANLITPFLYPCIINGIAKAPRIVLDPDNNSTNKIKVTNQFPQSEPEKGKSCFNILQFEDKCVMMLYSVVELS